MDETQGIPDSAVLIAQSLARKVFATRGNHSEAHLSEIELAACIALGVKQSNASQLADSLTEVLAAFRNCIGSAAFADFETGNPIVRDAKDLLMKVGRL